MEIEIRQEMPEDYNITERVIQRAFADSEFSDKKEHELVSRIRKSDGFIPELSLVAVNEEMKGHILLSRIQIFNEGRSTESLALAPVSVIPEDQNKGIGGQLIIEALEKAKELGYESVIVLGHPQYYPKFGFKRASYWNINPPFDVPDEAFMAKELRENALDQVSGKVKYPEIFFE